MGHGGAPQTTRARRARGSLRDLAGHQQAPSEQKGRWPAFHDVEADAVAIPDPGFAGSAFGALGYFALHPDYGMAFYEELKANGAVQIKSPDEVTTGVAEGQFRAGITLDSSARAAVAKGSPVELVWPSSGSVAMYSPVGVVDGSENPAAAEALVEFLLSAEGQRILGEAGQEPVLPGFGGPEPGGDQARPDWRAIFGQQEQFLEQYRAIFGG